MYIDHGGDLNSIQEAIGILFKKDVKVTGTRDFAVQYIEGQLQAGPDDPRVVAMVKKRNEDAQEFKKTFNLERLT